MKRKSVVPFFVISIAFGISACSNTDDQLAALERACAVLPTITSTHPAVKALDSDRNGIVVLNIPIEDKPGTINPSWAERTKKVNDYNIEGYKMELWKTNILLFSTNSDEAPLVVANSLNYVTKYRTLDAEITRDCFLGHPVVLYVGDAK